VTVTAEVVPVDLAQAARVEASVLEALERFLHPLSGGADGTGWRFGRRPHRSDVLAGIESLAGVDHVRALAVAERVERDGPAPDATLVYSGSHSIAITGGQ
jgi:hypothetical protein